MKIDIPIHSLIIKDKSSGEVFSANTMRSAREIADYIDESEKDILQDVVLDAINEALVNKENYYSTTRGKL